VSAIGYRRALQNQGNGAFTRPTIDLSAYNAGVFGPNFTVRGVDMSIQVTDTPDPVLAGGQIEYVVRVANVGPGTATPTTVHAKPGPGIAGWAGTFFLDSTHPSITGASCGFTPPNLDLTCGFSGPAGPQPNVPPGVYRFRVLANVGALATNSVATSFRVTQGLPETGPGDESVVVTTRIDGPPEVRITHPGPPGPIVTAARAVTIRGAARDDSRVVRVEWEDQTSAGTRRGRATGTDLGDPSWLVRNLRLAEGANRVRFTAVDDRGLRSAPAQIEFTRVPEATLLRSLATGGVVVVQDGAQTVDEPVLAAPGLLRAEIDPRVAATAVRLALNGEALAGTLAGNVFTAAVDVTRLPRDLPGDAPFVYRLSAEVELADGTAAPLRVRRAGQSASDIPLRVDSPVPPVDAGDAQSLWTALPPLGGPLRDVAVDASGRVWAVAGSPLQIGSADTVEVVDTQIRYVRQVTASATGVLLWHWDGSVWRSFTPAQLGSPTRLLTSVAVDASNLWIGTHQGLLRARPVLEGGTVVVDEVITPANGLAGSWVTSLRLAPDGRLFVGHRGSRYYRLHPNAVKRFWLDYGGVSVRQGSAWTAYRSDRQDDGTWPAVAGFDVTGVVPDGATGLLAGSEAGLSRFDGSSWSYENAGTGMTFTEVRALDAMAAEGPAGGISDLEMWVAGPDAVAWRRGGTWARFAPEPGGLPSGTIHDVRIDGGGRVFFATAAGVASFDPASRLWTTHTDAGVGEAGAVTVAPTGRPWTAVTVGPPAAGRVAEFNASLGVTLSGPPDRARVVTDADGLARVTLSWQATPGAIGYEVFLDGALIGRTTGTSRSLLLRPGTKGWTVRALLRADLAGPTALPRALRVDESRERGDAEMLLNYWVPGGGSTTRVLDTFRARGTSVWTSFGIDPGFPPNFEHADLAGSSDGQIASVSFADGQARPERYPNALRGVEARPSLGSLRVATTSEPGGLVLGSFRASVSMYTDVSGETGTLPLDVAGDVAGLARGRVAVQLSGQQSVRVYQRDQPRDPLAPVGQVDGVNTAHIAGLPDGGFAALVGREVWVYDASLDRSAVIPITMAGGPGDLAADEEGRIFLLMVGPMAPSVFYTRDVGPQPSWTPVPVSLPAGVTPFVVATYHSPALDPDSDAETNPPPPTGTIPLPGTDWFVYSPKGFTSCLDNKPPTYVLGFLRTDGPLGCDDPAAPTRLTGTGLFLDYHPLGYGPVPTGAPSGQTALSFFPGPFTLDLRTGAITPASGLQLTIPPLGRVTAQRVNVLGEGEYDGRTPRKGIGLGDGASEASFGFNRPLLFSNLFLTDLGGVFHRTFGGVTGLAAPFDKGAFRFGGTPAVPLRLRTTGDLRTQACSLNFDSVETEVLSPAGAVLFPLRLSAVCLNPNAASFGQSTTNVLNLFNLTFQGGSLTATGVSATAATLGIGVKTFQVTGFAAGTDGFRFATVPGLDLAGITADMADVSLRLPGASVGPCFPNAPNPGTGGTFCVRLASLAVTNFEGRLDRLQVPFDFFKASPSRFPTVQGGLLRVGPEPNPYFGVSLDPGLSISTTSITLPAFGLSSRYPTPAGFSIRFAGGQLTPTFVELNDLPPLEVPGFNNARLDFKEVRLGQLSTGGRGFRTTTAEVTAGPVQVTLRDFSITDQGRVDISGGGFRRHGFSFDVTRNATAGTNLSFNASFSFLPVVRNARGTVAVDSDGNWTLSNFDFDDLTLGPLRVRDPRFRQDANRLEFGATVGFGRFPDVTGRVRLRNGGLEELFLSATFSPPFQLYGPTYLRSVSGTFNLPRVELGATALITGGPELSFPPFFPGPYFLVTLQGDIVVSGLGYFETRAALRLFQGPPGCTGGPPNCFPGYLVGSSRAIVGNVYLNGRFVGVGMYFNGTVQLFGGVLDVGLTAWVYPPLPSGLSPGAQQGTYGADLNGFLRVPSYVPLIGGTTFGGTAVSLRGTFPPPSPARAAFTGSVQIPLCSPPYYWCSGVRWCQSCETVFGVRICSPRYPCGATGCGWRQSCADVDVAFRIDQDGFRASRAADSRLFENGYCQGDGFTAFTNFKLLGREVGGWPRALGDPAGTIERRVFFEVPEGVDKALFRIDFAGRAGDANLSLRFPDGRLATPQNTPPLEAGQRPDVPQPGEPLVFYRHALDASDPQRPLAEAAYVLRGPFRFEQTALTDADGTPTGEVVETFAPGDLTPGVYEVIVTYTGDAGLAPVELLRGNREPRLARAELRELGQDRYRIDWTADDPDGDPLRVRLHVGTDLDRPEFGQPIGDVGGYPVPGPVSSLEFDLGTPEFREQNIAAPLQLFLSIDDGFLREGPDREFVSFGKPVFVHVDTLAPPVSPKAPPQVTGVVVRPTDGAVEVYWDPLAWTPPSPSLRLATYGVVAEELGVPGTVGPPVSLTVPVPAGAGEPVLSEAVLPGLLPGHRYRLTVSAVAQETLPAGGPPLCPCQPAVAPNPGDACFAPSTPCGTPTDLTVEHAGRPSAAVVFTAPTVPGGKNGPPRFLTVPGGLALLGRPYSSPVRVEDPEGDAIDLRLCGCRVLDTDPPRTSCEPPVLKCDPPTPAGLLLAPQGKDWTLTYDPTRAGLGRHSNVLVARDGTGVESVQAWSLEVAHRGQGQETGTITSVPPGSVLVGDTFSYQVEITGLSPEVVPRFVLRVGPTGMQMASLTGLLTWVPSPADVGRHDVVLEVLDADPNCTTCEGDVVGRQAFTLEVLPNPLGGLGAVLSVAPSSRAVGPETGIADFEVSNAGAGTFDWTAVVEPGADWLTVISGGTGTGTGLIRLGVGPNPAESPRTGVLRVSAASTANPVYSTPRRVEVVQAGARLAVLAIAPTSYTTYDRRAGRFDVAIRNAGQGTLRWQALVVSGIEWLGLEGGIDDNTGVGDGRIGVRFAANTSGGSRTGVVRVQSSTAQNGFVDLVVTQLWDFFTEEAGDRGLALDGPKQGGLVWCDVNGDGALDVLANTSASPGRSRLYFAGGQGAFTDVTATHGRGLLERTAGRSAVCGDLNHDGWPDLVRNSAAQVEVYLNRGPGATPPWSFGDESQGPNQVIDGPHASAPAAGAGSGSRETEAAPEARWEAEGLALIDHDRDGDLDLLVDADQAGLRIFRNDGQGCFVSGGHFGLDGQPHRGDYVAVADYDLDGAVDVLSRREDAFNLAAGGPGNGFRENRSFTETPSGGRASGVAFCDLDADGDFDLVWGDTAATRIWRNQAGVFEPTAEPAASSGVPLDQAGVLGMACGDADNDGDTDLFLSAASGSGYLFLNDTAGPAAPLRFRRDNSGIDLGGDAPSVALGDHDRDGDLDLLVNRNGAPNQLWQNHGNDSGEDAYLAVRALACLPSPGGRAALGATVRLFAADGVTPAGPVLEASGGSGHGSQGTAVVHFGLPAGPDQEYVVEVRFLAHEGPGVVRRSVTPSKLGAYQVVEVRNCQP
jgi:hypothetical protein